MAQSSGVAKGHDATVKAVDGPVTVDDSSHALRLAAAKDLVRRCNAQLADAEAALALLQGKKEN